MSCDFLMLASLRHTYRSVKRTGDGALRQLSGEEMCRVLWSDGNSVEVLVQHLRGNMTSRWANMFVSDGENEFRDRDAEFVPSGAPREQILAAWEEGWAVVIKSLNAMASSDFERTVVIRGQVYTVPQALHRQLQHYSYHVGQIVLLARIILQDRWCTLSIARGESKQYRQDPTAVEPPLG